MESYFLNYDLCIILLYTDAVGLDFGLSAG